MLGQLEESWIGELVTTIIYIAECAINVKNSADEMVTLEELVNCVNNNSSNNNNNNSSIVVTMTYNVKICNTINKYSY